MLTLGRTLARGLLLTGVLARPLAAQSQPPSVNPYGPTVVAPATLTVLGSPEFETYGYWSNVGPGFKTFRQTPFLVKYTYDPRWQINASGSGWQSALWQPQGRGQAFGDTTWALKYLLVPPKAGDTSAQALQLSYKVPASNPALGFSSGLSDTQLTYYHSRDLGSLHLDFNTWLTDLGVQASARHLEYGHAVALSTPVNAAGTLGFQTEWSYFARAGDGVPARSAVMTVLSLSVDPRLTLSVAADFGLTPALPHCTYILGSVFHFAGPRP